MGFGVSRRNLGSFAPGRPNPVSLAACHLSDDQRALIGKFTRRMLVLCLVGAWCGDCVEQCPIFAHFARGNPSAIDFRLLDRDTRPKVITQMFGSRPSDASAKLDGRRSSAFWWALDPIPRGPVLRIENPLASTLGHCRSTGGTTPAGAIAATSPGFWRGPRGCLKSKEWPEPRRRSVPKVIHRPRSDRGADLRPTRGAQRRLGLAAKLQREP